MHSFAFSRIYRIYKKKTYRSVNMWFTIMCDEQYVSTLNVQNRDVSFYHLLGFKTYYFMIDCRWFCAVISAVRVFITAFHNHLLAIHNIRVRDREPLFWRKIYCDVSLVKRAKKHKASKQMQALLWNSRRLKSNSSQPTVMTASIAKKNY